MHHRRIRVMRRHPWEWKHHGLEEQIFSTHSISSINSNSNNNCLVYVKTELHCSEWEACRRPMDLDIRLGPMRMDNITVVCWPKASPHCGHATECCGSVGIWFIVQTILYNFIHTPAELLVHHRSSHSPQGIMRIDQLRSVGGVHVLMIER